MEGGEETRSGRVAPAGWRSGEAHPRRFYEAGVADAIEFMESGGWSEQDTLGLNVVGVDVDDDNGRRHPDRLLTLRHPLVMDGDRVLRDSLRTNSAKDGQLWLWGHESCAYPPDLQPIRGLPRAGEDGPGMHRLHPSSRECPNERAIAAYLVAGLKRLLRSPAWGQRGSEPAGIEYRPANDDQPAAYRVDFARDTGRHVLQVALEEPDGRRMAAGDAFDDFQTNLPLMPSDGFIAGLPLRS